MIHETAYIGPDCVIEETAKIDAGAIINNAYVGHLSYIGPNAVVGSSGFGYAYDPATGWTFKPHEFGVYIGKGVHIGANTCVDRGSWRDTWIDDGTKIDNLVHIAHNVEIGRDCCIVAGAEISGSCVLEDRVYVAPKACVRERLTLGEECIVGLGAVVVKDVPARMVVAGNPARVMKDVTEWPPPPPEGK